jgi:hypothetical protein
MSNMFLNIVSTFKGTGISAATKQLGAFGKETSSLGNTLGKVGAAIASFGIAAKAVQFTSQSIDSARDLERNMFSLKTIFDEFTPTMTRFTREAYNIGLSQKDAAKASTFLGSVLKQSGFSMEAVTEQTQKLVSLGVDLAATYGYDVQEALLGMTALFRGEYDPIEKFGVAMKQSEINSELAARGQNNLEGALRRNAEQVIRMELLYERAADATGAFTGQSGNLFVEQKKLQAQFENMQASIGTQLLPVMGALVEALVPLVEYIGPKIASAVSASMPVLESFVSLIKDMSDDTTTTGQTMEFLTDTIGSFFKIAADNFGLLVQLAGLFISVSAAIGLVNAALALTTGNWVVIGIGALIGAILILNDATKKLGYSVGQSNDALRVTNSELEKSAEKMILVKEGGAFVRLTFKEASDEAKRLAVEVANADNAKLENLRNSLNNVRFSAGEAANELRRMRVMAGVKDVAPIGTGTAPSATATGAAAEATAKAPTGIQAWLQKSQEEAQVAQKRLQLIGSGLSEAVVDGLLSGGDALQTANDALFLIATGGLANINMLTEAFKNSAAGQALVAQQAAKAAEEAAQAAEQARQREQEILDKRKAAFESFSDSVKSVFGGIKESIMSAFSLPDLGNSVNSITRNIKKLLERTRDFAKNITSLSQQGLSNELLQQIIAAGPMQGGRLAQALAGAGGGVIGGLNQAFGEFGGIASDIAGVGTGSAFGNAQVVNTYNIEVNGGVGSGPTIGKAIVDAIKSYERTSGAVWQGA